MDLLVLGQVTIDHVVPATPGPWHERLGGNALYAAAGARLFAPAARIGVVARVGHVRERVQALLEGAGLSAAGLVPVETPPLTEWLLYEADGQRQSVPRLPHLRDPGADAATLRARYLTHIAAVSATAAEIPAPWRAARAVHLAPQVGERHRASVPALTARAFVTVDPSPHYSLGMEAAALAALLGPAAFLPSEAEIRHLAPERDFEALALRLRAAGVGELAIKCGAEGVVVLARDATVPVRVPPLRATPVDLTGAGDSFGGAYCAARLAGADPVAAARAGAVAASMVIECAGAPAALALSPAEARRRLG